MTFPTNPEAMLAAAAKHAKDRTAFMAHVPDAATDGIGLDGSEAPHKLGLTFGRWIDQPQLQEGPGAALDDAETGYRYDLTGLDADDDLGALKSLHGLALSTYREIVGALRQVRDDPDPSLNHDGRLKIAARVMQPKLDRIAEVAERELARTEQAVEVEMDAIAAECKAATPEQLPVHSDVRAHFKGLKDSERQRELSLAIASGDRTTLQALTAGPAYLGGLTPSQHGQAQEALAWLVAPDRVRRVNALRAGQGVAAGAVARLQKQSAKFLNFDRARELLAHEARRQAEMG